MLRIFIVLFGLLITVEAVADKIIVPPKRIVKIAKKLSYSDFPNYIDILAVIRVESSFNQLAENPEIGSVGPSRGLMQVQNGSMAINKNMYEGTGLLREYYKTLGSREGAVKAYNIGITRYKRGGAKISAEQYWQKFKKRRREYEQYYK